jgi:predicted nucleotide-binding protein
MAKKKSIVNSEREITYLIKPKKKFITELEERIELGQSYLANTIDTQEKITQLKKEFASWNDYNLELLKQSFNIEFNEYRKSYDDAGVWSGMRVTTIGARRDPREELNKFLRKVTTKIENLEKLVQKTNLLKSTEQEPTSSSKEITFDKSQVFIVHGHDDLAKTETARFIEKLGLEPIILHEQASSGKTIIEKIEEYSNVSFGIILYTPCDLGAKQSEKDNLKNRARQNVVFEHGYLIGKIGRENVCALVKGNVETPNDISGVVYVSMENDWKLSLAKELINSGYDFDASLILK